jgi:hypothetical protein
VNVSAPLHKFQISVVLCRAFSHNPAPTNNKKQRSRRKTKRPTGRARRGRINRVSRGRGAAAGTLSAAGTNFLKTALAAPDFGITQCSGIPDLYGGKSVMKQFCLQQQVTFTPGKATTLIFLPSPGVAYWSAESEITAQPVTFAASQFADAESIFDTFDKNRPTAGAAESSSSVVDRFRFSAFAAELECTMNEFTWAGTIQVAKAQVRLVTTSTGPTISDTGLSIEGFQSVANMVSPNGQLYTAPIKDGFYSPSMNESSVFNWCDVRPGAYKDSFIKGDYHDGLNVQTRAGFQEPAPSYDHSERKLNPNAILSMELSGPLIGLDEHDAIIVRVVVPAGAQAQSCLLKTWQNVEFVPMAGSLFADMSLPSPPLDLQALATYEAIARELPVAVKQSENPGFWQKVKKTILSGSGLLSKLPGPFGIVAKGVHALFNMF